MILKFKQTYDETKTGKNCIIVEQIQGTVTSIVYQEKIFEVADVKQEDIIFDLSGRQYNLTKINNVKLIMNDSEGKLKEFEIDKNEITHKWEMNGSTYDNLKELYYDLSLV
jgi:hypothetical protein